MVSRDGVPENTGDGEVTGEDAVSLHELHEAVMKNTVAANAARGKHSIITMGFTQSGKTTTNVFLLPQYVLTWLTEEDPDALGYAGYSSEVSRLVVTPPNENLMIGTGAGSVTTGVHFYPIEGTRFFLVDTAGLNDDNRCVSREVGNMVGVRDTLNQAESVRLVLVLNFEHLKASIVKELSKLVTALSSFMGGSDDWVDQATIVLTHVCELEKGEEHPKLTKKKMLQELGKKLKVCTSHDLKSEAKLLKAIMDRVVHERKGIWLLDPVNDAAERFRDYLTQDAPQLARERDCQLGLIPDDRRRLTTLVNAYVSEFMSMLREGDEEAREHLKLMASLSGCLPEFFAEAATFCTNALMDLVKKEMITAETEFGRMLLTLTMDEGQLQAINSARGALRYAHPLIESFLPSAESATVSSPEKFDLWFLETLKERLTSLSHSACGSPLGTWPPSEPIAFLKALSDGVNFAAFSSEYKEAVAAVECYLEQYKLDTSGPVIDVTLLPTLRVWQKALMIDNHLPFSAADAYENFLSDCRDQLRGLVESVTRHLQEEKTVRRDVAPNLQALLLVQEQSGLSDILGVELVREAASAAEQALTSACVSGLSRLQEVATQGTGSQLATIEKEMSRVLDLADLLPASSKAVAQPRQELVRLLIVRAHGVLQDLDHAVADPQEFAKFLERLDEFSFLRPFADGKLDGLHCQARRQLKAVLRRLEAEGAAAHRHGRTSELRKVLDIIVEYRQLSTLAVASDWEIESALFRQLSGEVDVIFSEVKVLFSEGKILACSDGLEVLDAYATRIASLEDVACLLETENLSVAKGMLVTRVRDVADQITAIVHQEDSSVKGFRDALALATRLQNCAALTVFICGDQPLAKVKNTIAKAHREVCHHFETAMMRRDLSTAGDLLGELKEFSHVLDLPGMQEAALDASRSLQQLLTGLPDEINLAMEAMNYKVVGSSVRQLSDEAKQSVVMDMILKLRYRLNTLNALVMSWVPVRRDGVWDPQGPFDDITQGVLRMREALRYLPKDVTQGSVASAAGAVQTQVDRQLTDLLARAEAYLAKHCMRQFREHLSAGYAICASEIVTDSAAGLRACKKLQGERDKVMNDVRQQLDRALRCGDAGAARGLITAMREDPVFRGEDTDIVKEFFHTALAKAELSPTSDAAITAIEALIDLLYKLEFKDLIDANRSALERGGDRMVDFNYRTFEDLERGLLLTSYAGMYSHDPLAELAANVAVVRERQPSVYRKIGSMVNKDYRHMSREAFRTPEGESKSNFLATLRRLADVSSHLSTILDTAALKRTCEQLTSELEGAIERATGAFIASPLQASEEVAVALQLAVVALTLADVEEVDPRSITKISSFVSMILSAARDANTAVTSAIGCLSPDLPEAIDRVEQLSKVVPYLKENRKLLMLPSFTEADRRMVDSFPSASSVIAKTKARAEESSQRAITQLGAHDIQEATGEIRLLSNAAQCLSATVPAVTENLKRVASSFSQLVDGLLKDAVAFWHEENYVEMNKLVVIIDKCNEAAKIMSLRLVPSVSARVLVKEFLQGMVVKCKRADIDDIAEAMMELQVLGSQACALSNLTTEAIGTIAEHVVHEDAQKISDVGTRLRSSGALGVMIVENHCQFKAMAIKRFLEVTAQPIATCLKKTKAMRFKKASWKSLLPKIFTSSSESAAECEELTCTTTTALEEKLTDFHASYTGLIEEYELEGGVKKLLSRIDRVGRHVKQKKKRDAAVTELISLVFVLWTLTASRISKGGAAVRSAVYMRPHTVQLLAIYRILGLDGEDKTPVSHLVNLKTGEGKGIVLGVLAIVFAKLGNMVDCVCYSDLLSARDYAAFQHLFKATKVDHLIRYGTVDDLFERRITERAGGNVRTLATKLLANTLKHSVTKTAHSSAKSVLLVDEADILSDYFAGRTYVPATLLVCDDAFAVIEHIWSRRNDNPQVHEVVAIPQFKSLVATYPDLAGTLKGQVRLMLKEVQTYDERPYVTTKEGISYAQHTSVSSKIASGHQRTFAYMAEMNKAEHFSKDFVKERVGFFIVCTKLSYASIANDYNLLFGVSGTICADTSLQQSLLRLFKFEKITYLPSMFVNALLRFNEQTDTILCDDYDEHFLTIQQSIKTAASARAALVIFENKETLEKFAAWQEQRGVGAGVQILHENSDYPDSIVSNATLKGAVTLLTKAFGRGTDFVCFDVEVNRNGGVRVILTFVPDSVEEFIQFKGRTARRGEEGDFRQIFLRSDVTAKLELSDDDLTAAVAANNLQDVISAKRDVIRADVLARNLQRSKDLQNDHKRGEEFLADMADYQAENRKAMLQYMKLLTAAQACSFVTRFTVVVCMDVSGSMKGQPWEDSVNAFNTFVKTRRAAIERSGHPNEDRVGVVVYHSVGSTAIPISPLAGDISLSATCGGGTNFAAGINASMQMFLAAGPYDDDNVPVFIFMSDGGSSSGDVEMRSLAAELGPSARVHVQGFGSGADTNRLTNLAAHGNGTYRSAADGVEFESSMRDIGTSLEPMHL